MPSRSTPIVFFLALSACSGPSVDLCDEIGTDPLIVTGLSGVIDGTTPAVEVVELIPETCEERASVWMFWDDAGSRVSIGPAPSDGVLSRENLDVTDETIFFRDFNVGVRLHYAGGRVGSELALAWFSTGADLATVDCSAVDSFACAIRE